MDAKIIEKLKKEIQNYSQDDRVEDIGRVTMVADGIAEIDGLSGAKMNEMVVFDNSIEKSLEESLNSGQAVTGLVLNLEENSVKVVILGDTTKVAEGALAKSTGQILSIPVSDEIVGRVVNPLGDVLDGKPDYQKDNDQPIENEAYGVIERGPVDTPLHTGTKAIDALVPIGRGQRELIIGDRVTGKTTLAIDTILNQKNEPKNSRPICVYVAIGQKESKTAQIQATLEEHGAMEYTSIISASAAAPAALQYLAPFAGAAIGEYFMKKGRDVLVIYDDLSKHAVAYRQMSLLLRRPPGREAYPGDIFYLHSRLLERAAKLSEENGGGSVTALPIIETKEGDISAYIPTNVISITDGQIFLLGELFNKNTRPAIDVGRSVSRVGSSAQTKAMKKVAGKIRIELANFRELEAFMQFSQDLDQKTKEQIERGERLSEILKQNQHSPMGFERQVVVIYAAVNGLLAGARLEDVSEIEQKLLGYIDRDKPELFEKLNDEKAISDDIEALLEETLSSFKETHSQLFRKDEDNTTVETNEETEDVSENA